MKVLLIWPILPNSFWSYQETLDMAGLRSTNPPLGLITIAAMLPSDWEIRLIDRNIRLETEADWQWCDMVIISAMIIQKEDFQALIKTGVSQGKKVAVGGPFPTSIPDFALAAGADYLILDEGECTIPLFLEALAKGETKGVFRATEKPDVTQTPIPSFDLLELDSYMAVTLQFSRGCPFQCEFCDIINLFGRKPRTKNPEQMLAELDVLYSLGWQRYIFLVDDNFVGNKRNAKLFLKALIPWMENHNYPFTFLTEASLNLAEDEELMALMVQAGFTLVFLGIETPDVDSLVGINKEQNTRASLVESCHKITQAGLQIMSGFIIGFDGEKTGAGTRIYNFIEETGIPQAHLSLLQALHGTQMWQRLKQEERLFDGLGTVYQGSIMNFQPTRPVEEIVQEYIDCFWKLYEPSAYLERTFRHFQKINPQRPQVNRKITNHEIRFFVNLCWRQGIIRPTRWSFWRGIWTIAMEKPCLLYDYLVALGIGEHFFSFRHVVKSKLLEQLAGLRTEKTQLEQLNHHQNQDLASQREIAGTIRNL